MIAFLSYISELGLLEPERFVFTPLFVTSAFLTAIIVFIRHDWPE